MGCFARSAAHGCPLGGNIVLWADGMHIPVCKPAHGQRFWCCGHPKVHCLKALVITMANGLLMGFGPFDGSTHNRYTGDDVGLD